MRRTAFISHRECAMHDVGDAHPETPARLSAIIDHLRAQGLDRSLVFHDAPLATTEQLLRVHGADYLARLKHALPEQGLAQLDSDTVMSPHTWQAALRAAGSGVLAVDLVMRGQAANAFCCVRPPGHHAGRDFAMGFCFLNNIAVAAAHALAAHGLERVAIVDFDVHHGNGTEDCFADDARVLMAGIFQHPSFPYCGTAGAHPNMLNVALPAGSGSDIFRQTVCEAWLPRLQAFAPQMVLISAGFDAHYEEDLGGMCLVEKDYAWVTEQLLHIAAGSAEGRIVSMLEGGYVLPALARSVAAHLKALAGI